jgi:hypothetical protein
MKVVIINGKGGCGKDTFVVMCRDILGGDRIGNISTVDFVKKIATECGWDGTKIPENRKFLSDLKDLLTEWNNVPFNKVVEAVNIHSILAAERGIYNNSVIFIHCREPKEIKKLVRELDAITLLIRRDAAECVEQVNHADNEVLNYEYDYVIPNNGTLSELRARAEMFLRECFELDI